MSREIKQTTFTLSEVECLLAQERDRGAGFIVDLTKKYDALLAAEREKALAALLAVRCGSCGGTAYFTDANCAESPTAYCCRDKAEDCEWYMPVEELLKSAALL